MRPSNSQRLAIDPCTNFAADKRKTMPTEASSPGRNVTSFYDHSMNESMSKSGTRQCHTRQPLGAIDQSECQSLPLTNITEDLEDAVMDERERRWSSKSMLSNSTLLDRRISFCRCPVWERSARITWGVYCRHDSPSCEPAWANKRELWRLKAEDSTA